MSKEVIIKKYKFLLGVSEESLEFLEILEKEHLNELFLQTANAVNGGQTELWERLAKSSNFMPSFIAAKLSENVFGEVICANVAAFMKVKDALGIIGHLSIDFMSRVTPHMIPEKTVELVNAIPLRTTRKITQVLLKQEDHYTIARFVDTLEISKVVTIAMEDIKDERVLLRISKFVENKQVVSRIFMAFPDRRKLNLLSTAYIADFREELRLVMTHLSVRDIEHLLSIIPGLPEDIRQQVAGDLSSE